MCIRDRLDSLLVLVLLNSLCEGSVQDLASMGRDARGVKAVEDLAWGYGFIARGTAAVFGTNGVFVGGGDDLLLACDLCFAGDVDGTEEAALLGVTVGLTVWNASVSCASRRRGGQTHVFPFFKGMGFSPRPFVKATPMPHLAFWSASRL